MCERGLLKVPLSASLRWNLSNDDRLNLSVGRTVRRPNFDFILPLLLEEEYGDNDFLGNPRLDPETAWGIDLGFERRLGRQGIVGVNLFYRDVSDLIEVVNTGEPSVTALDDFADDVEDFLADNPGADETTPGYPVFDPDSFVYTAANVGDGVPAGTYTLSAWLDGAVRAQRTVTIGSDGRVFELDFTVR